MSRLSLTILVLPTSLLRKSSLWMEVFLNISKWDTYLQYYVNGITTRISFCTPIFSFVWAQNKHSIIYKNFNCEDLFMLIMIMNSYGDNLMMIIIHQGILVLLELRLKEIIIPVLLYDHKDNGADFLLFRSSLSLDILFENGYRISVILDTFLFFFSYKTYISISRTLYE